jgi:hypothetical protein
VIVPLETSPFAIHGVQKLVDTIALLSERIGHSLKIASCRPFRRPHAPPSARSPIRGATRIVFDTVIRSTCACARRLARHSDRQARPPLVRLRRLHVAALEVCTTARRSAPSQPSRPSRHRARLRPPKGGVQPEPERARGPARGDFNNWIPDQGVETRLGPNGTWEKVVRLGPGVYQYRYFVDGEWQPDPSNPRRVEGPAGGVNSVLIIS